MPSATHLQYARRTLSLAWQQAECVEESMFDGGCLVEAIDWPNLPRGASPPANSLASRPH